MLKWQKKIEVSIKFQILKPNSVLTMKMLMRLPRMVMIFYMCANVASANKPPVSLERNSWFHVDGC